MYLRWAGSRDQEEGLSSETWNTQWRKETSLSDFPSPLQIVQNLIIATQNLLQKCNGNTFFFAFMPHQMWRTSHMTSSLRVKMAQYIWTDTDRFFLSKKYLKKIITTILDSKWLKTPNSKCFVPRSSSWVSQDKNLPQLGVMRVTLFNGNTSKLQMCQKLESSKKPPMEHEHNATITRHNKNRCIWHSPQQVPLCFCGTLWYTIGDNI